MPNQFVFCDPQYTNAGEIPVVAQTIVVNNQNSSIILFIHDDVHYMGLTNPYGAITAKPINQCVYFNLLNDSTD